MSKADGVVVQKRMSFLASLVWGISSVIIVALLCSAGVLFYGMSIVDGQSSHVLALLMDGPLDDLPAFAKSVPMLADAIQNQRVPEYAEKLDVRVSFSKDPHYENRLVPVVTVANKGQQLVAWLHLRLVVRDSHGNIVGEEGRYVATPVSFDEHDAPGSIMPGAIRTLSMGSFQAVDDPTAEYEITDIRVWVKDDGEGVADRSTARRARQAADQQQNLLTD